VQIIADDGEPDTVAGVKSGVITASVLQRPYDQGLMLAYCLTAIKVLGTQQAMALMSPYFTSDNTLSTGVGIMTKDNVGQFQQFWNGIGIGSSQ
jgi:ABC-type sugar transport system substrate-binding protein